MAKIGIDVDGVIADFIGAFNDVVNHLWPGRIPLGYEPTEWDYPDVLTKAEMKKAWGKAMGSYNFWLGLDAYRENVMALSHWLIQSRDQEVYLVTSRSQSAGMNVTKQTEWWLKSTGVAPINNYLGIIVVPDSNEKWKLYQSGGFTHSIDDKGETIQQCDLIHPHLYDHKSYLLDRPWNKDYKVRQRVYSLAEYLREIK